MPFRFGSLCFMFLLVARCCLAGPGDCGSVTIRAVNLSGQSIDPVLISEFISMEEPTNNLLSHFAGSTGKNIPCGDYDVLVNAGGLNKRQRIHVAWPSTMFVLLVGSSFPDGGLMEGITGEIVGGHDYEKMWVKVVRAASDDMCCTIIPVSSDGHFYVASYEPVEYVFVVNSDSGVLFLGRRKISDLPAIVKIDLRKGSISATYPGVGIPATSK